MPVSQSSPEWRKKRVKAKTVAEMVDSNVIQYGEAFNKHMEGGRRVRHVKWT